MPTRRFSALSVLCKGIILLSALVNRACCGLLICASATMIAVVVLQVVCRYLFNNSLFWSEEAARYIMVWISMLGASIGIRRKGHIGVEAVVMLLPAWLQRAASVVTTLIASGFFAGMIFFGFKICQVVARQESPAMEISMAVPYSALLVGGALMLLYSLEEFFNLIAAREGGGKA